MSLVDFALKDSALRQIWSMAFIYQIFPRDHLQDISPVTHNIRRQDRWRSRFSHYDLGNRPYTFPIEYDSLELQQFKRCWTWDDSWKSVRRPMVAVIQSPYYPGASSSHKIRSYRKSSWISLSKEDLFTVEAIDKTLKYGLLINTTSSPPRSLNRSFKKILHSSI